MTLEFSRVQFKTPVSSEWFPIVVMRMHLSLELNSKAQNAYVYKLVLSFQLVKQFVKDDT